MNHLNL